MTKIFMTTLMSVMTFTAAQASIAIVDGKAIVAVPANIEDKDAVIKDLLVRTELLMLLVENAYLQAKIIPNFNDVEIVCE